MNKIYIDGVIVVEGKSDVSYLSSFVDSLFFITNGYDINDEKIEFLINVSKKNKIYVLTDNDEAGTQIKNRIKSKINGVITLKTPRIARKNYKKFGVAETEQNEIIKILKPFYSSDKNDENYHDYNLSKLISLSKDPEKTREEIIKNYRLIKGNNKSLENQLKMLKVDPKDLIEKYGN